jgi:hypothetical protein
MHEGVVDEKGLLRDDVMLSEDEFKDLPVGFLHPDIEGEPGFFENGIEILVPEPFGKPLQVTVVMYLVGVAEEEDAVVAADLLQQAYPVFGNVTQERIPCIVDGLVG